MKKRILVLSLILAAVLIASLSAGCGNSGGGFMNNDTQDAAEETAAKRIP
jgi:hypothetical protein